METRMNKGFLSGKRLGQLLLRDLTSGYRSLLIAMAAVGGVIIVISVLSTMGLARTRGLGDGAGFNFYLQFLINVLFVGGFIVTSFAFREVWQSGGGIFYLTIPGSIFEKFLSKLLVTSVGFALGTLVYMAAVTAAAEGLNHLLFGFGHGTLYLGTLLVSALKACLFYVITQSAFLLGSIWFRKAAFIKTALTVVVFGVILGIVASVAVSIFLSQKLHWSGTGFVFKLNNGELQQMFSDGTMGGKGIQVFKIASQVLLYAMAPVFWLATYFRLSEAEV